MKKRQFKKYVKKMTDEQVNEHTAYCEKEWKQKILYAEFDKRFPELSR